MRRSDGGGSATAADLDRPAEPETADRADPAGADPAGADPAAPASDSRAVAAVGVAALAVTKAGDVMTTAVGLRLADGLRERNPLAAAVMAEFGTLPGLLVLGAATVVFIAAVVEAAIRLAGRLDDDGFDRRSGRFACYGVGCLCNVGVTVYNAVLIAGTALGA